MMLALAILAVLALCGGYLLVARFTQAQWTIWLIYLLGLICLGGFGAWGIYHEFAAESQHLQTNEAGWAFLGAAIFYILFATAYLLLGLGMLVGAVIFLARGTR